MARLRTGLPATAVALALAACGSGTGTDGAETTTLRFASYNVPDAAESVASQKWADEIEEATNGEVTIEFYYQEALLSGTETLQGVADGRADMGFVATAYYPAELPLSNVAGLPFITDNPVAQGEAFLELYESDEQLRAEWENQGVKAMVWAPVASNIVATKEPVDSIEDLRGKQIRGYGYVSTALDAGDVNVVGISQTEVYEALQRGVLDATSGASMDIAIDRGYEEVSPHFVDINYGNYAITANVISLSRWEQLSDDHQAAIEEVSERYLDLYLEELTRLEDAACDALLEAGGDVTLLPEEDTRAWAEVAGTITREAWINDVSNSPGGADADAFFANYEQALAAHSDDSAYETAMQRCAERS